MTHALLVGLIVGALMVLCSGLDLWRGMGGPESGTDTPFLVFLIGVVLVIASLGGLAFQFMSWVFR